MRTYLRSTPLGIVIVGLFAGGILLSQALGWWSTESRKIARKITTGEFAGKADPADIRGSYSFQDIEKNFGVPVKILEQAFAFEQEKDPGAVRAKDLETKFAGAAESQPQTQPQTQTQPQAQNQPQGQALPQAQPQTQTQPQAQPQPAVQPLEIGTDALRLFVALYVGIPYSPKEGTGIPESAFRVLKENGKLSPEKEKAILPLVVKVGKDTAPSGTIPTGEKAEPSAPISPSVPSAGGQPEKSPTPQSSGGAAATGVTSGSAQPAGSSTGTGGSSTSTTEPLIKGKTTFKEVLAWGVTKAQIEKVLGRPMPAEGTVIKDWCASVGLEFGTIRDALQKLKP